MSFFSVAKIVMTPPSYGQKQKTEDDYIQNTGRACLIKVYVIEQKKEGDEAESQTQIAHIADVDSAYHKVHVAQSENRQEKQPKNLLF